MKRQRGRGRNNNNNNGGKPHNNPNRSYESNGPDMKLRGSASHIYEKYLQIARDRQSSGDRIAAENYLQHAEHYYRIVAQFAPPPRPQQSYGHDDDESEDEDDVVMEPRGGLPVTGDQDGMIQDTDDMEAEEDFVHASGRRQMERSQNREFDRNRGREPQREQGRDAPRDQGRREGREGARSFEPRRDGARNDGSRNEGGRNEGGRNDGQRFERGDGRRFDGRGEGRPPRRPDQRSETRQDGPRMDGYRADGFNGREGVHDEDAFDAEHIVAQHDDAPDVETDSEAGDAARLAPRRGRRRRYGESSGQEGQSMPDSDAPDTRAGTTLAEDRAPRLRRRSEDDGERSGLERALGLAPRVGGPEAG